MMQYNGEFGCSYCYHKGEVVDKKSKNNARIYCGGVGEDRTLDEYIRDLEKVEEEKVIYRGCKGPTELSLIDTLNPTISYPPEYMHAAPLGVAKMFMKAWFSPKNKKKPFYLNKKAKKEFNRRMKRIRPTNEITWSPESFGDDMKASQMKNIIVYYSLPCLKGLMPDEYYKHWFLFVYAVSICLQDKISKEDEILAEKAFASFVADTERLYGRKFMRFNVHIPLHMVKFVKYYGALWAWSAFPFENYNGVLSTLFHGTQYVTHQIWDKAERLRYVKSRASVFNSPDCDPGVRQQFLEVMGLCRLTRVVVYGEDLRGLGVGEKHSLDLRLRQILEAKLREPVKQDCTLYNRFILRKTFHSTCMYTRSSKRFNHTVALTNGEFIMITALAQIVLAISNSEIYVIFRKKLEVLHDERLIVAGENAEFDSNRFWRKVRETSDIMVYDLNSIDRKCIFAKLSPSESYVIPLVNKVETD